MRIKISMVMYVYRPATCWLWENTSNTDRSRQHEQDRKDHRINNN